MTPSDPYRREHEERWIGVSFDAPATFRILVRGQLDRSWEDRLGGMKITAMSSDDGGHTTELRGRLADQAALSGVLNGIYELHLPLLLVECLSQGSDERQ